MDTMEYQPIPDYKVDLDSESDRNSSSSEELLNIYIPPDHRPFRDIIFTFLFVLSTLMFCLLEFKTLYETKFTLDFNLVSISSLSLAGCLVWFSLLVQFTRPLVWITLVSIPISLASFIMISKRYEFSLLFMLAAFIDARSIRRLDLIYRFGVELIKRNYKLIIISIGLTFVNLVVSFFMASVALNMERGDYYEVKVVFLVLMYFWISSFLKNLEKTVVASGFQRLIIVVGESYFNHDVSDVWWHFSLVSTRSFGQIAFCSLILGISSTIRFLTNLAQKHMPRKFLAMKFVGYWINASSVLVNELSAYTLVYVGLTGDSFLTSGYHCTKLFKRNMILGLLTTSISRLISFGGKVVVSAIIGYTWYANFESQATGFKYYADTTIGFAVPFYIMGIFTHVFETT